MRPVRKTARRRSLVTHDGSIGTAEADVYCVRARIEAQVGPCFIKIPAQGSRWSHGVSRERFVNPRDAKTRPDLRTGANRHIAESRSDRQALPRPIEQVPGSFSPALIAQRASKIEAIKPFP